MTKSFANACGASDALRVTCPINPATVAIMASSDRTSSDAEANRNFEGAPCNEESFTQVAHCAFHVVGQVSVCSHPIEQLPHAEMMGCRSGLG